MSQALRSLVATGTKLYLDSIDPVLVQENLAWGATGATSNPIIVSNLLRSGRFDGLMEKEFKGGASDSDVAWLVTDHLVRQAQDAFLPVWEKTGGNEGWVSFELDPLIEDPKADMPHAERVARYIELGKKWSAGHKNRMIKVPATPAGIDCLEELTAHGVTLNVTLIFTARQYEAARNAVWRGALRRSSLAQFKSVYSIFVSRVDQYTKKEVSSLSAAVQGMVGIVNAKRLWLSNQEFWKKNPTPLQQEIIFASTGTKDPSDPAWKYVGALAGSDIQTNPPETNQAISKLDISFTKELFSGIAPEVISEVDAKVDPVKLETTLMKEGIDKFAQPQHALIELVGQKRAALGK